MDSCEACSWRPKGILAARFRQLIRATFTGAELDHLMLLEESSMLPSEWTGRRDVRDPAARAVPPEGTSYYLHRSMTPSRRAA
jgi:hypothetical protein